MVTLSPAITPVVELATGETSTRFNTRRPRPERVLVALVEVEDEVLDEVLFVDCSERVELSVAFDDVELSLVFDDVELSVTSVDLVLSVDSDEAELDIFEETEDDGRSEDVGKEVEISSAAVSVEAVLVSSADFVLERVEMTAVGSEGLVREVDSDKVVSFT